MSISKLYRKNTQNTATSSKKAPVPGESADNPLDYFPTITEADLSRFLSSRKSSKLPDWVLAEMRESGISRATAERNIYFTSDALEIKDLLNNKYPVLNKEAWTFPILTHSGSAVCLKFSESRLDFEGRKRKYEHTIGSKAGLMIPFPHNEAQMIDLFGRHGVLLTAEDLTQSYLHCLLKYGVTLHICEGAKKAMSLLDAGYFAVAIQGCWQGTASYWVKKRTKTGKVSQRKGEERAEKQTALVPALDLLLTTPRKVVLVPDNDDKPKTIFGVTQGFYRLAQAIIAKGCKVVFKPLVGADKGVDDFLVNQGADAFALLPEVSPRTYYARLARLQPYKQDLVTCLPSLTSQGRSLVELPDDAKNVHLISGKGTGKTLYMLLTPSTSKYKVIIVPRQQLANNIADRAKNLGIPIAHYKNTLEGETLVICADSLPKLNLEKLLKSDFEVYVDEVELCLRHILTSSTCRGNREYVIEYFNQLVTNASRATFLSADTSFVSIDYIASVTGQTPYIVHNQNHGEGYTAYLDVHCDYNHSSTIARLIEMLGSGKKCFVFSDSRRMVDVLYRELEGRFVKLTQTMIHSENTNDPESKELLVKIANNKIDLDVLIASPSLGTGVSIEQKHFGAVFGIFSCGSVTVPDMLQGLMRVRDKTVPRYISIYDIERHESIDFNTVRQNVIDRHKGTVEAISYSGIEAQVNKLYREYSVPEAEQRLHDLMQTYEKAKNDFSLKSALKLDLSREEGYTNPELIDAFVWMEILRNFSLNNPVRVLCGLLEADGHQVVINEKPHNRATLVEISVSERKEESKLAEIQRIVDAPLVDAEEFKSLDARVDSLTSKEKAKLAKYRIHDLCGRSDFAVVELNQRVNLFAAVTLQELVANDSLTALRRDLRNTVKYALTWDRANYSQVWKLLDKIGVKDILHKECDFTPDYEFTQGFVAKLRKYKKDVKNLLGMTVEGYTMNIIKNFVKKLGLSLFKDEGVYYYCSKDWDIMQGILAHRREKFAQDHEREAADLALQKEIQNPKPLETKPDWFLKISEDLGLVEIEPSPSPEPVIVASVQEMVKTTELDHVAMKLVCELHEVGAVDAARLLLYPESRTEVIKHCGRYSVHLVYNRTFLRDLQRLHRQDRERLADRLGVDEIRISASHTTELLIFELRSQASAA